MPPRVVPVKKTHPPYATLNAKEWIRYAIEDADIARVVEGIRKFPADAQFFKERARYTFSVYRAKYVHWLTWATESNANTRIFTDVLAMTPVSCALEFGKGHLLKALRAAEPGTAINLVGRLREYLVGGPADVELATALHAAGLVFTEAHYDQSGDAAEFATAVLNYLDPAIDDLDRVMRLLHIATYSNRVEDARRLFGSVPHRGKLLMAANGREPLIYLAAQLPSTEMLALYMEMGSPLDAIVWSRGDIPEPYTSALVAAARNGHTEFVREYLARGLPHRMHESVLISAMEHTEMFEMLVRAGWLTEMKFFEQEKIVRRLAAVCSQAHMPLSQLECALEAIPNVSSHLNRPISSITLGNYSMLYSYSVSPRNLPIAALLMRFGADPHLVIEGRTAYAEGCVEFRELVDSITGPPLPADDVRGVPAELTSTNDAATILAWLTKEAVNVAGDREPISFDAWDEMDYETIRTAVLVKSGAVWHAFLHSSLLLLANSTHRFNPITRISFSSSQLIFIRVHRI